jgi:hypothetical protein
MADTDSVKSFIKLDKPSDSESHADVQTGSPAVQKKKVPNVISGSKASVDDQVQSSYLGNVNISNYILFMF